ncbi:unnamed protein product [Dibothriocephalus latus]|uniref:DUF5523 domain-containing protein n=1 Tax=Dibothriocephalus latus TaxID=60516 RepID=A0A3P7L5L7_DIBLA|nr:unnamed protein product [Dibothriocephalus latus]
MFAILQIVSDWQALKQKAEITEEEEVNFFVRESWPMEAEGPKSSDKENIKYVRERAEQSVVGSVAVSAITQQPRASGDFAGGLLDSQPHDLVWGRGRWPLPFERIEAESHILYSPSGLEVPLEVKTQGRSVRYAEDEGLYVGQLPFVAPANIRRLENRLLREAEYQSGGAEMQKQPYKAQDGVSQWFAEDGRMKMATSPLRDVLFRPLQSITFFNNVPEEFNYVFLPPLSDQEMQSLGQNYSRVHSRIQRPFQLPFRRPNDVGTTPVDFQQIEIELASVSFSFHPLFLAEHVFAHNLRMLVKALEDRVGRDYINACIQRIAALKRAIKQLEEKAAQKVSLLLTSSGFRPSCNFKKLNSFQS